MNGESEEQKQGRLEERIRPIQKKPSPIPGTALLLPLLIFTFSRKQRGGEIPFPGVGQQGYDGLASVSGPSGKLNGGPHCRAGGGAYQYALQASQLPAEGEGVFVLHGNDLVTDVYIQNCRDKARTNTLELMVPGGSSAEYRRGGGFYCGDADGGILPFEILPNPR